MPRMSAILAVLLTGTLITVGSSCLSEHSIATSVVLWTVTTVSLMTLMFMTIAKHKNFYANQVFFYIRAVYARRIGNPYLGDFPNPQGEPSSIVRDIFTDAIEEDPNLDVFSLSCPITHLIFLDPVRLGGHCYDRNPLYRHWRQGNKKLPLTRSTVFENPRDVEQDKEKQQKVIAACRKVQKQAYHALVKEMERLKMDYRKPHAYKKKKEIQACYRLIKQVTQYIEKEISWVQTNISSQELGHFCQRCTPFKYGVESENFSQISSHSSSYSVSL